MKNILTIGFEIPGYSDCYQSITSNISMLDGDVIIFCPDMRYQYDTDGYFSGKPKLLETSSREIENDSNHWRKEIIEALKANKTIFVFLREKEEYSIFTHREFSGTGRSRSPTNYYSPYDNYQWVPIKNLNVINVKGTKIQKPKKNGYASYFNAFQDELSYEVVLEAERLNCIFQTSSGTRIVGGDFGDNLIFIPYPKYSDKKGFTTKKEGKEYWSNKGLEWGEKLVSCLIEIDKSLTSGSNNTPPPSWLAEKKFHLKKELALNKAIQSSKNTIDALNKKISKDLNSLESETQLKGLLYEQGKPLEAVVIKALKILGYQAEGYDDGTLELDQIILSPEGERFIGECEGKDTSAIAINKFRQLADAIHEDYEKEEVKTEAIGILFGNAQRLTKPAARKGFFTLKCIKGAERRKYALVRTTDLFYICKYLIENTNVRFKKECRKTIIDGLGGIIKFPKIPTKT